MKSLILIWALLYSSFAGAVSPVGIGNQGATPNYSNNTILPYSQATKLSGVNTIIETGNENMLADPGMEAPGVTAWTCTSGTCTKTSTTGEFTSGKQALKVALSAQALNVSQSVSTTSGIQAQGVVGVAYKIPSAITDFQVCSLVAGSEQTCVPSASLIADGLYHSIEIPVIITAGSTVGIKFKTTATYTQNVFFDAAYVKQGIGYQNLMLDNYYSAQGQTSTGTLTNLNKTGWISGCTAANPSVCTLSGFTVAPNCSATSTYNSGSYLANIANVSSTAISIFTYTSNTGSSAGSVNFTVSCQKSGNDYLASSSNVYQQASANFGWTSYTPTFTNFGTPTAVSFFYKREGDTMHIRGTFTPSTGTGGSVSRVSLPSGFTLDSTKFGTSANVGTMTTLGTSASGASSLAGAQILTGNTSTISFNNIGTGASTQPLGTEATYASLGSPTIPVSLNASVPITGWSNSSVIVGLFADMVPKIAYLSEQQSSGTSGGSSVAATWTTRTLNTLVDNAGIVTSLSSNQFVLPAGTYRATGQCQLINHNGAMVRLRNITDSVSLVTGISTQGSTTNTYHNVPLDGEFTITSAKTIAFQYYATSATATFGLGSGISNGEVERFTQLTITKIK